MLRVLGAVIVGYIVLVVLLMSAFSTAYAFLGPNFAFEPGSLNVTNGWLVIGFIAGFIAANAAGWIAARIAGEQRERATLFLSALILGFGLALAVGHLRSKPPEPTKVASEMTITEAGRYARQPAWYEFVNPLVGVAGIILGSRLERRRDDDLADDSMTTDEQIPS